MATPEDINRMYEPPTQNQEQKMEEDKWLQVCEWCALPDCIIPPGGYQLQVDRNVKGINVPMLRCPAAAAKYRGIEPEEVLTERRQEFNLLPVEIGR